MSKLSLAGEWKLRGEFMDVTADRCAEVLAHLNAMPPKPTIPGYLTEENMTEEEREMYLKEPDPKFTVNTALAMHPYPSKTGYIPMTVPGDVTTALIDNGVIEEPFLKDNTKKSIWIKELSWWLVKEFDITEEMLNEDIVRLNIEMLDFNADILVNGIPAGHQENTFCAFSADIKRFLHVGTNQIVIRLTSGMELNYPHDTVSYYCASDNAICDQRVYTRKPQFTYGWDWCQPVPTCGIGRSIEIEAFSGAQVIASRIDTLSLSGNDAEIEFHFEIEKSNMVQSAETELEYELSIDGKTAYTGHQTLMLVGGINFAQERVVLKDAKLWWPNGYGAQNLYTFTARCTARGITHEAKPKKIGIRTLSIDFSKLPDESRNFFFKINGTRIFCKGGNWVPTDSIYLRTPDENYKKLVSEGAAAHFTMFRMWGGGTYEPDCFYDYCSEYGILLMHDFMYACAFYPDQKDSFLYEAEREAEYQTKRLAHYPCMAVWTGNNEIAESYTDWFPVNLLFRPDAAVTHEFPLSSLLIHGCICLVIGAHIFRPCPKICGGYLGRPCPCDPCHFDLYPKPLLPKFHSPPLSPAGIPKQLCLVLRRMHHQVIPFIPAFIKAYAPLGIPDQLIFTLLQLQGIRIEFCIDAPGIEQKLMGRD